MDLISIDLRNHFIDTGVHPTSHQLCRYQIVYGKLSISKVKQRLTQEEFGSMTPPAVLT